MAATGKGLHYPSDFPDKLLSLILVAAGPIVSASLDLTRYAPLRVSRQWRKVALSTPALWTTIHIHYSQPKIATLTDRLNDYLRLSSDSLLNITFFGGENFGDYLVRYLEKLLSQIHRIEKLCLDLSGRHFDYDPRKLFLEKATKMKVLRIRSTMPLRLERIPVFREMLGMQQSFRPRLGYSSSMTIDMPSLETLEFFRPPFEKFLPRITGSRINNLTLNNLVMGHEAFIAISSDMPALEELVLTDFSMSGHLNNEPLFPSLRRLTLETRPIFQELLNVLPPLEYISVKTGRSSRFCLSGMDLSKLTELELYVHPGPGSVYSNNVLQLPFPIEAMEDVFAKATALCELHLSWAYESMSIMDMGRFCETDFRPFLHVLSPKEGDSDASLEKYCPELRHLKLTRISDSITNDDLLKFMRSRMERFGNRLRVTTERCDQCAVLDYDDLKGVELEIKEEEEEYGKA